MQLQADVIPAKAGIQNATSNSLFRATWILRVSTRDAFAGMTGTRWIWLTVVLCAGSWAAMAQEYYNNVVIVLDASGSMSEMMGKSHVAKMDAAKTALKQVVAQLPPTTHVGLLVFSGMGVPDKWLFPLGPRDDAALMAAINRPRANGNTPLGQFIKIGADRLLEEREKQHGFGSYRLLIVTDGQATDGNLMDIYTPQVLARGIVMDVIGVAMQEDHLLAKKAHSYRKADDPAALTKALSDILAEISTTGNDAASREAFDLLAPIPTELAAAMLGALTKMDNKPIGKPAAAATAGVTAPPPNKSAPVKRSSGGSRLVVFVIIACIALVINVVAKSKKKKR